ncbi:hypothetical protein [Chryseobacterium gossypii]|uniref:hypothetical protein n=1 Tax=Chryseobacterium gossypii TaxID=3231602 RepID=UPI003523383A
MLVCISALSKAQQGRVGINTATPSATLDIVANTTDNARPDALLVPRMSEDQLAAKNAAYNTAQNGAFVFVNAVDGTTTAKTVNVTATGFYYYDAPNNVWKAVGSGSAVNTALVVSAEQTTSYTVPATEDIILLNVNVTGQSITLPTTGVTVGKKLYVTNRGSQQVDIVPAPRETANTAIQPQQAAILIYLGGTGAGSWSYLTGF